MSISDKFYEILETQKLKPNTIKNYISQLNMLIVLFKSDNNLNFIKYPEQTILKIEETYSNIGSISNKISLILSIIKYMYPDNKPYKIYGDKYTIYRNKLSTEITNEYKKQVATPDQIEKSISPQENDKIKFELLKLLKYSIKTKKDIESIRNYLLYMLFDTLNTRTDIAISKFVLFKPNFKYNNDYNYIVLDKSNEISNIYYMQNNYKTEGAYKQKTLKIDNSLYKLFLKLYNAYKKFNVKSGFVFYQDDLKNPLNEDNTSKLYKRIGELTINKPISIQIMRIQKSSNDYEANEALKTKAQNMGHSLITHTGIYSKKNISKI